MRGCMDRATLDFCLFCRRGFVALCLRAAGSGPVALARRLAGCCPGRCLAAGWLLAATWPTCGWLVLPLAARARLPARLASTSDLLLPWRYSWPWLLWLPGHAAVAVVGLCRWWSWQALRWRDRNRLRRGGSLTGSTAVGRSANRIADVQESSRPTRLDEEPEAGILAAGRRRSFNN